MPPLVPMHCERAAEREREGERGREREREQATKGQRASNRVWTTSVRARAHSIEARGDGADHLMVCRPEYEPSGWPAPS